ncbi:MAG: glycosyltransferase [Flavobacteriaceae bacterium]
MLKEQKGVFIIAQSWPCDTYGGSIAVTSSLKQYCKYFDKVIYLCLNERSMSPIVSESFKDVLFQHIPVKKGGFLKRFGYSLLLNKPAITIGMGGSKVFGNIKGVMDKNLSESSMAFAGIIEDNVPGVHLKSLKKNFPRIPWVFKSHDVLHEAFSIFKEVGSPIMRLAWGMEINKIFAFEKKTVQRADLNWTITQDDLHLSESKYQKSMDGVFDSDIPQHRYENVKPGNKYRIIYLGSADSRKGHGIRVFIKDSWPTLHKRFNEKGLKLILGGRLTESFDSVSNGVEGIGYVENEIDFLGEGSIFINPQVAGTGLKLKSLVAMASGKVLVTTTNGALGLGGKAGKHYVVANSPSEMVEKISLLLNDEKYLEQIRTNAKIYIKDNFSEKALEQRVLPLLNALWEKQKGVSNE